MDLSTQLPKEIQNIIVEYIKARNAKLEYETTINHRAINYVTEDLRINIITFDGFSVLTHIIDEFLETNQLRYNNRYITYEDNIPTFSDFTDVNLSSKILTYMTNLLIF